MVRKPGKMYRNLAKKRIRARNIWVAFRAARSFSSTWGT